MPRKTQPPASLPPALPTWDGTLTQEQVSRWANLIAEGQDTFPDALAPADRDRLQGAVRQRLRDRLVCLIVRAMASRLRQPRPEPEAQNNA